ncbi:MAG: chaplin [Catenulispora sp.]|nr:chaplin [Catenulispora sp.]
MIIRRLLTLAFAAASVMGVAATASADNGAVANGVAVGSPGLLSGNVVEIPINIPINVCGNTVSIIGLFDDAFGNVCVNR